MDSNLMGSSRGNRHFQERHVFVESLLDHPDMADRGTALRAVRVNGHQRAVRNDPDGRVDHQNVRMEESGGQGQIDFPDSPLSHRRGQDPSGPDIPGEQNRPGCPPAKPVKRGTIVPEATPGQTKQGVFQKSASGKNRQAGGFRQDQDAFVFMKNREIRGNVGLFPGRTVINQEIARRQILVRGRHPAVQKNLSGLDPLPPGVLGRVRVPAGIKRRDRTAFVRPGNTIRIVVPAVFHFVDFKNSRIMGWSASGFSIRTK